jgi:predicted TIM-barrel enzyme
MFPEENETSCDICLVQDELVICMKAATELSPQSNSETEHALLILYGCREYRRPTCPDHA